MKKPSASFSEAASTAHVALPATFLLELVKMAMWEMDSNRSAQVVTKKEALAVENIAFGRLLSGDATSADLLRIRSFVTSVLDHRC